MTGRKITERRASAERSPAEKSGMPSPTANTSAPERPCIGSLPRIIFLPAIFLPLSASPRIRLLLADAQLNWHGNLLSPSRQVVILILIQAAAPIALQIHGHVGVADL